LLSLTKAKPEESDKIMFIGLDLVKPEESDKMMFIGLDLAKRVTDLRKNVVC